MLRNVWVMLAILASPAAVRAGSDTNWLMQGTDALESHDYDKAVDLLTRAIAADPKDPLAYRFRGVAYRAKGELEPAVKDLNESVRLNDQDGETYYERGVARELSKDAAHAREDFDKAVSLMPKHVLFRAEFRRASLRARQKDYAGAIEDYIRAEKDFPKVQDERLQPEQADIYNGLAWLYATCPQGKIRDGAKAVDYARKACAMSDWKDGSCLDTLAAAYAERGDFAEAVKRGNEAMKALDSSPEAEEVRKRLKLYEQKQPYRDE